MEDKVKLCSEEEGARLTRRIRQILMGGIKAGVILLGERGTRRLVLEVLQQQKLCGKIGADGRVVLYYSEPENQTSA